LRACRRQAPHEHASEVAGTTLVAGYYRGRVDALVTRLLDLIWSFPAPPLGVPLGTAVNL
jgi:ABC-type dipeptide/oligopeptide/nickel transport system permease subunit